ncbi:MAG: hypothetical protein NTV38_06370 [Chloroflexi bacterium]|nr:hypothetical protein [Chloroflexota bacterium]
MENRLGDSIVLQGDAYDLALELQPVVDLIITSPPYWGLRTYGLQHNWALLSEWTALGHEVADVPPYVWYRKNGGILGL